MKRILLIAGAMLLAVQLAMPTLPLLITDENVTPFTEKIKPNYDDDRNYSNFVGRLYIDDVGIDVALYKSNKQYVVDRDDSAAYFDLNRWPRHMLIADHNTEAFAPLGTVEVGMVARIVRPDGEIWYYECTETFDGHNTGKYITDWNWKNVVAKSELLMYTCFDGWQNVKVTLWKKIDEYVEVEPEDIEENIEIETE